MISTCGITSDIEQSCELHGTISGVGEIVGAISTTADISGWLSGESVLEGTIQPYNCSDLPNYTGDYEVTPTQETQTLSTAHKVMTKDVTINPIPEYYGLITWDGATLTVS